MQASETVVEQEVASDGPSFVTRSLGSSRAARVAAITFLLLYAATEILPVPLLGLQGGAIIVAACLFLAASVFRSVVWPIFGLIVLAWHIWYVYQIGLLLPSMAEVGAIYEGTGVVEMNDFVAISRSADRVSLSLQLSLAFLVFYWIYFAITSFCLWRMRLWQEEGTEEPS